MKKSRFVLVAVFLVILSWRAFVFEQNKRDWNKRVAEANQSDLYGKVTNGQSNDRLVEIARRYLDHDPAIYLNGSPIQPTDPKLKGIRFDPAWFSTHAPGWIEYNLPGKWRTPDDYLNDRFIVVWHFMPGCEKRREDTVSKPNWFDAAGHQCLGGYGVNVLMTRDLRPVRIDISQFH